MRKSKDNLGQNYQDTQIKDPVPELAAARTGVTSIEVMIYEILAHELESLSTDEAKRTAYLAHLFDAVAGKSMREMISKSLSTKQPQVVYGYPRLGAETPCVAIILEEEHEAQQVLGSYLGETLPEERTSDGKEPDPAEYVGGFWEHTYALLVYTEHPQITAGLYQVVKAILVAADHVLELGGFQNPSFSGGELGPEQEYIPENVFCRVLKVQGRTVFAVPEYGRDPERYRVTVHRSDLIVDGVRGGVGVFTPESHEE